MYDKQPAGKTPGFSERELNYRYRIDKIFLTISGDEMYGEVLTVLLESMASEFGVFGYIDEKGALVVPSMTRHIWNRCQIPEKNIVFPRETWGDSIWPRAIREKKILYSNEHSALVPEGHIDITRNITVPIVHMGDVIGLFQVANKKTAYTRDDLRLGQILADAIAPVLHARLLAERKEKARKRMEKALQDAHDRLEERVKERTAELTAANERLLAENADRKKAEKEKSRLEAQLRQTQQMEAIGRLAGGVAHDFNNMLTAIRGYSELIESSLAPDDPRARDVKAILKAAESCSQLTSQLLAFSRKQTIEPRIVDINQRMNRSQKILLRLIEEDIELRLVSAEDLWRTKVDPGQLDQILINLVINARDAMPNGGNLTIETANVSIDEEFCRNHIGAVPGEFVMLAVSDDGYGMEKEVLDNIFEPFFTTKEMGKGTGLGLSTVYGIIKQHGGFIHADSEPGEGTSVRIYLPRVRGEVEEIVEPDKKTVVPGKETVLLAEDQEMVRTLTRKMLENNGYRVLEAESGSDAYRMFKKYAEEIHLLLTDVEMPEMNGKELYERVVSIKPDIRVLYMSGYTDDIIAHRGVLDEDTALIEKPFDIKKLLRKVREVLDAP